MGGRARRQQLLLSTAVLVGALSGYARNAYAQAVGGACNLVSGTSYECSGSHIIPQSVTADDAQVRVESPGLIVDTTALGGTPGTAMTIIGDGAISFFDPYGAPFSSLTSGAGYDALSIISTGDIVSGNDGSVTVTTNGTLLGGDNGIFARNDGGGAVTITANGDVEGTSIASVGIFARNEGTSLSVTTAGTVTGGGAGISAGNYGNGALTIEANGAVNATAASGIGIFAQSGTNATPGGTSLSVKTEGNVYGGNEGIYVRN